jgi:hypothetical protein
MDTPAQTAHGSPAIDSASVGDPRTFQPLDLLEERLLTFALPRDAGRLVMIVRRGPGGVRESLDRVALTTESGIPGDAWGRRSGASLNAQLTVIQSAVAELIANGQPLELFGDNLYMDIDLSSANLPIGSRLRAGGVTLEVSPLPHKGCQKFNARFGSDALKFVSKPELRHRNLRGVYMKVVEGGELAADDRVEVLSR